MRRASAVPSAVLMRDDLLGLGLELALLDLLLLERQHVGHRLFLRLGRDDLLLAGGLGGLLALDLVGLGFERGLLDLLVLQFEREAHLLAREFLGEQRLHAALVVGRQVDLADLHVAQHDAVGGQLRTQFGLDHLLDLGALGREDLAHRVAREHAVDHAAHRGRDDLAVDVGRQVARDGRRCAPGRARSAPSRRRRWTALRPTGTAPPPSADALSAGWIHLLVQVVQAQVVQARATRTRCRRARTLAPPLRRFMRTPISPLGTLRSGGCVHRPQAAATPTATSVSGSSRTRGRRSMKRSSGAARRAAGRRREAVSGCSVVVGHWVFSSVCDRILSSACRAFNAAPGPVRSRAAGCAPPRRKHSRPARRGHRIIEPGCRAGIAHRKACPVSNTAARVAIIEDDPPTSDQLKGWILSARPGLQVDQWFTATRPRPRSRASATTWS